MPRPINVRKERATLAPEREETPQRVQVAQSQRLYQVKANTRGLDNFVSKLGQFAHREKAEADQAEEKRLALQGEADAARDTVDDDLMDREAYSSAVNGALGEADAAVWSVEVKSRAAAARQEARANGEEWDAQAFFQQEAGQVQEGEHFGNDTYAARWGRHLARVEAEILGADAQATATEEAEQANVAIQSLVYAQMKAGSGFEEGVTKDYAESVGLDPQERVKATVDGVKSFITQANTLEELSRAEAYYEKMPTSQKALFGDDVANAIRARKVTIEAGEAAENNRTIAESAAAQRAISGAIQGHDPNAPLLIEQAVEGGYISRSKGVTYLTKHIEDQENLAGTFRILTNPDLFATSTPEQQKATTAHLEELTSPAVEGLIQLVNGGDGNVAQTRVDAGAYLDGENGQAIEASLRLGLGAPAIKDAFVAAEDPQNANMVGLREARRALVTRYGPGVLNELSPDARVNMDRYDELTLKYGHSDEEARAIMTSQYENRSYGSSLASLHKGNDTDAAVRSVMSKTDATSAEAVKDAIGDLAAEHYQRFGDRPAALDYAKREFSNLFTVVEGRVLPNAGLPPNFAETYEDGVDTFHEELVKQSLITEDDHVNLIPAWETGSSGRFFLMTQEGDFLYNEDGTRKMLSGLDIMNFIDGRNSEVAKEEYETRAEEARAKNRRKAAQALSLKSDSNLNPTGIDIAP